MRVERGDQHERVRQVAGDPGAVGLDALRAVLVEGARGIGEQHHRFQDVVQHHRLVDVELEVALRARERHRMVVAEHLHGHHGQRLALGRVDLARHDGGAGLVLGNGELVEAGARPAGVPAHVVGDLHEGAGERAQRAARRHHRIVRRQGRELVGRRHEGQPGRGRKAGRDLGAERGVRVEPGADRRAAERQPIEARQRAPDAGERIVDLRHPARDRLAERERRRVLQVGAADHHDVVEGRGLGGQGVAQVTDGGDQLALDLLDRRDVHHGREGVVGGLPGVHVVVGMDRRLGAEHAAGELDRPVGDDLVGVHVGLGARARLEHHQRELGVPPALDHLAGRLADQLDLGGRELAERAVDLGGAPLEEAHGADHRAAPREPVGADREIGEGALGLGAPQVLGGHLHRAQRVLFGAEMVGHRRLRSRVAPPRAARAPL